MLIWLFLSWGFCLLICVNIVGILGMDFGVKTEWFLCGFSGAYRAGNRAQMIGWAEITTAVFSVKTAVGMWKSFLYFLIIGRLLWI